MFLGVNTQELRVGVAGGNGALRFSLACLDFSFLFRGVQRGYFSFQRERSEIMKADDPLISAKELTSRSRFPLADHGSMSDSAISHHLTLLREESQLFVVAEKPVFCAI
jgi:hypothetical protein